MQIKLLTNDDVVSIVDRRTGTKFWMESRAVPLLTAIYL